MMRVLLPVCCWLSFSFRFASGDTSKSKKSEARKEEKAFFSAVAFGHVLDVAVFSNRVQ